MKSPEMLERPLKEYLRSRILLQEVHYSDGQVSFIDVIQQPMDPVESHVIGNCVGNNRSFVLAHFIKARVLETLVGPELL